MTLEDLYNACTGVQVRLDYRNSSNFHNLAVREKMAKCSKLFLMYL